MRNILDIIPTLGDFKVIADIGCHDMGTTSFLRNAFPLAVIHAFEPDPRNIRHITKNNLAEKFNVAFHPIALGEQNGECSFWPGTIYPDDASNDWTASGSTRRPVRTLGRAEPSWLKFDPIPISVQCKRLDDVCLEYGIKQIDFIWIDAQGAEDMIFEGAKSILATTRFIYTEHNAQDYESSPGIDGIMKKLPGWSIMEMWPYDALIKNDLL